MPLLPAVQAFLSALEGPRNAQVTPTPPVAPSPDPSSSSPGRPLEELAFRMASVEARLEAILARVKEEADRAERAAERARKAHPSASRRSAGRDDESDADGGVQGGDDGSGEGGRVRPVPTDVVPGPTAEQQIAFYQQQAAYLGVN